MTVTTPPHRHEPREHNRAFAGDRRPIRRVAGARAARTGVVGGRAAAGPAGGARGSRLAHLTIRRTPTAGLGAEDGLSLSPALGAHLSHHTVVTGARQPPPPA